MAALELMSSGRSPENDMISAEQIRGLTQQLARCALHCVQPVHTNETPSHWSATWSAPQSTKDKS